MKPELNLSALQSVYDHDGPFVSVHLDVSRNTEDAPQQLDARWTTARHALEHAGVSDTLVRRIDERIHEPVDLPGEVRRTLVAAGDEVLFEDTLAGAPAWPETVTCGDLPDVTGWLHQVDRQVSFLLVLADREGADLELHSAITRAADAQTEVAGETLHLHKFKGGGWSHKRFQQRSDNTAEGNARQVAEEIRALTTRHRPRVVLLAGDDQARALVQESLGGLPCEVHQVKAGGRAAGSSADALWEEVGILLTRLEAEDQQQLTGRLDERHGQGQGAALGVDAVLGAFVQRQVDTLLLDPERARELPVKPARLPGLPLPGRAAASDELPADQVLVAAAVATDAEVRVLPAAQIAGGGIAALLRWDE